MKKQLLFLMTLAVAAVIVGCGDDDECASCPTDPQKGLVFGHIEIDEDTLEGFVFIAPIDGALPDVDSVKLSGHRLDLEFGTEDLSGWFFQLDEPAGSLGSGDTVQFVFYLPGSTAIALVRLLDYDGDAPTGFNHPVSSPYDAVAIGESITVSWNAVPLADWYSIEVEYRYDSLGTHEFTIEQYYQTETSITVSGLDLDYNGRVFFRVKPISGPMPNAGGNISGDALEGSIVSASFEMLIVYVGTGVANPSSGETAPNDHESFSVDHLVEMYR